MSPLVLKGLYKCLSKFLWMFTWFQVFIIVNNIAVNTWVQSSFSVLGLVSPGDVPPGEIFGAKGTRLKGFSYLTLRPPGCPPAG